MLIRNNWNGHGNSLLKSKIYRESTFWPINEMNLFKNWNNWKYFFDEIILYDTNLFRVPEWLSRLDLIECIDNWNLSIWNNIYVLLLINILYDKLYLGSIKKLISPFPIQKKSSIRSGKHFFSYFFKCICENGNRFSNKKIACSIWA